MKGPILEFKDDSELQKSLEEWQSRLFLDDWIIKARLVDSELLVVDDVELLGLNNYEIISKSSLILIAKYDESMADCITKYCAEKTLVHELLHCKYNLLETNKESITSVFYDMSEHVLLEQMAKSLILAKYNIDFSWFKNFGKPNI